MVWAIQTFTRRRLSDGEVSSPECRSSQVPGRNNRSQKQGSFPLDRANLPPLPKHHEIVRRVNALFRVRLQLSVVAASRSTSEDE